MSVVNLEKAIELDPYQVCGLLIPFEFFEEDKLETPRQSVIKKIGDTINYLHSLGIQGIEDPNFDSWKGEDKKKFRFVLPRKYQNTSQEEVSMAVDNYITYHILEELKEREELDAYASFKLYSVDRIDYSLCGCISRDGTIGC